MEEFGAHDWRTDPTAANADEPEGSLPFPTLEKVLTLLDPKIGLNLEIKYPQFIDVRITITFLGINSRKVGSVPYFPGKSIFPVMAG